MFKHILTCIIIFTSIFLEAQVKNECNPDSSYYSLMDSGRSNFYKSLYTYNGRRQMLSHTRYIFHRTSPQDSAKWRPNARFRYTYGSEGPLSEYYVEYWFDTGWTFNYAVFYDYDPIGRPISETMKVENAGKLLDVGKIIILYDLSGREFRREHHQWDYTNLKWHHGANTEYVYDDLNRITKTVLSYWNNIDSIWDPGEMDTFIYVNGQLSEKIHSNRFLDFWQKDARYISEYDRNGRQTQMIHQLWEQNSWKNVDRELYAYTRKSCLTHTDYAFKWTDSTQTWSNLVRDTFYYGNSFVKLSFYPNPAHHTLYVDAPGEINFGLVDNIGRTVFEQKVFKGENEIDISMLASGWYIVNVPGHAAILIID